MERLKPLVIGDLVARRPVIQGGMGVGISLSSLAGAVAREGGIGILSAAQIGFREPDFAANPFEANKRAIRKEFKKARELAPDGIIGFNIMVAVKGFGSYAKEAAKAGADLIISGAGLPVELPEHVAGFKTKIAPIVSTKKSAMVICKLWDRKYHRVPDLVVVEGPLAGGHLGFSREQLAKLGADTQDVEATYCQEDYDQEVRGIIQVVAEYREKYQKPIPVVTAGGIYTHQDLLRQLQLGADGVQVGTRFVTTEECDAPMAFKQAYIQARKEDVVITKSPVGMPGRAINNTFLRNQGKEPFQLEHCYQCLDKCDRKTIPYCITKALVTSARGQVEDGLVFCGSNAWRAEKMETVAQVMEDLAGY